MERDKRKAFGTILLLALFVSSQAFFWSYRHIHFVNGVAIVHSHPFQGNHDHTESEALSLYFITNPLTLEPTVYELPGPVVKEVAISVREPLAEHLAMKLVLPLSLRGPPIT
jgi:hypothetical protein